MIAIEKENSSVFYSVVRAGDNHDEPECFREIDTPLLLYSITGLNFVYNELYATKDRAEAMMAHLNKYDKEAKYAIVEIQINSKSKVIDYE